MCSGKVKVETTVLLFLEICFLTKPERLKLIFFIWTVRPRRAQIVNGFLGSFGLYSGQKMPLLSSKDVFRQKPRSEWVKLKKNRF